MTGTSTIAAAMPGSDVTATSIAGWIVACSAPMALASVSGWIVEASTGRRPGWPRLAAVLAVAGLWAAGTWPADPVLAPLAVPLLVWGVALSRIDAHCRRLPDVLVLTAYPPVGGVLLVVGTATADADRLLRAALAATAALSVVGGLALLGGIGLGDAKLAGLLALVLGWLSWAAVFTAGLLALVAALVPALRAWRAKGRTAGFAFGPPLLLGALLAPSC